MRRYLLPFFAGVFLTDAHAPRTVEPYAYSSRYLTMRDGVRLAIDVYLPVTLAAETRLPTILHQTRYFRSHQVRWFAKPFFDGVLEPMIARYVAAGYAYVVVDTRGSGASFGTRSQEFSPEEIADAYQLADWVVAQPWSNGAIGATGGSYEGAATEFLASTGHPAVKAIVPVNCLFDAYTDMAFPGGVPWSRFLKLWGPATAAMDRNDVGSILGRVARAGYVGVRAVDGDSGGRLLREAVAQHANNYNVSSVIGRHTFKDETHHVEAMSPFPRAERTRASNAVIYSQDGWYDGALMEGAIKRFLTVSKPGNRLLLGPWNHKSKNLSPFATSLSDFDHTRETLRFFDHYLRGIDNGIESEPPVRYYTVAEEAWHTAATWPPPSRSTRLYLDERGTLSLASPRATGADRYQVDTTLGSGRVSRWMSMLGPWDLANARIPDRTARDKALPTYASAHLDRDMEVTGHPVVNLFLSSTHTDGIVIVYLEDVDPEGNVHYVSEGLLRLVHRKLSDQRPPYTLPTPYHSFGRADALPLVPGETAEIRFSLFPISYLFRKDHSVRIAIAGADADQFDPVVAGSPVLHVHRGGAAASRIELPVVDRPSR